LLVQSEFQRQLTLFFTRRAFTHNYRGRFTATRLPVRAAIKKIKRQAGEKKELLLRLGGHGAAVIKTTHLDACGAE
jgi:hypothetical protein